MQPDARMLRQLQAVLRLRVMQREQAESAHERSRENQRQAQRLLDDEQADYREVLQQLGSKAGIGLLLDPSQHEQRLLAQQAAHQQIETRQRLLTEASSEQQQALAALLKCKVAEDVAEKARGRVAEALRAAQLQRDSIDVADAQQARGNQHGF